MRKTLLVIVLACLSFFIWADKQLGFGFDALFLQDFAFNKTAVQLNLDGRLRFAESYEIRIPVTVSVKQTSRMIDTGIYAICYPYKGLFFGVSVFEIANFNQNPMILNEIIAGWNFPINEKFFIEPSLVIKDPTGTYSNEYSTIRGVYPCYKTFRVRLTAGITFNLRGEKHVQNSTNI